MSGLTMDALIAICDRQQQMLDNIRVLVDSKRDEHPGRPDDTLMLWVSELMEAMRSVVRKPISDEERSNIREAVGDKESSYYDD